MRRKIGFIGAGNMADAMIGALLHADQVTEDDLLISDISANRISLLREKYGITTVDKNAEIISACSVIVLSVKPQVIASVLQELSDCDAFRAASGRRLYMSIAAGIPISRLEAFIYDRCSEAERENMPIVRVMPNTPALVGAGMSGMCANAYARPEDIDLAKGLLSAMGRVAVFEEEKMDAVTAVSGSGPAYGFYVLEAMAEAGEKLGLTRADAATLARAALSGALALIEQQNESPESLRSKVTSPGGTTEAAIRVLEENNVKGAFIEAIAAAAERARQLSKPSKNQ